MTTIYRCFVADFKKTKHLPFWSAHLIIPICVAGVFLLYYTTAPWNAQEKINAYFQTLGIGFPILISLFSVMLAEQELSADSYQTMLSAPKRLPMFYSKLILLIACGAFSVFLASVLFGVGNLYVIKQSMVDMPFYLSSAFVLVTANILLYIFHWFLALRFNKGVSIIISITESIVTALLLTGMGEEIWCYVPCAWASRLITCMLALTITGQAFDMKCIMAISLCVILTVCTGFLFGIWACHWDGQHTDN